MSSRRPQLQQDPPQPPEAQALEPQSESPVDAIESVVTSDPQEDQPAELDSPAEELIDPDNGAPMRRQACEHGDLYITG